MIEPVTRVLYVTDDRESYARGNYYLAYQRAFMRQTDVTLVHPLARWPDPAHFDLVVLGHASVECFARVLAARFLPARVRARLWLRHASLRALRRTRTPIALFTKNDYKHFDLKSSFIAYVQPQLVITHTRSALTRITPPAGGRMIWLPFGVDTHQFTPPNPRRSREFVVGFRGNANTEWNAGERERFFRALGRLENEHPVSLALSKDAEGFLVGEPYVDWIRSCALLGATVSAAGTVGPRFLEGLACGTAPIAPQHAYEDFLIPHVHYVPVEPGPDQSFPGLEAAVARYLDDAAYRQRILDAGRKLVEAHTVDQHVIHIRRDVGA